MAAAKALNLPMPHPKNIHPQEHGAKVQREELESRARESISVAEG